MQAAARRSPAGRTLPAAVTSAAAGLVLSMVLHAPPAVADTTGQAADIGLQRATIAVNHAVAQSFPQIERIAGFRPDPLGEHQDGLALDILIPGDPASPEGIALGDSIRDYLLSRAADLGVVHVIWRQQLYRPDGTSAPMQPRGGDVANHVTHLHVTTVGGGFP